MFDGVIVVMGVSGTGKTETARRLADRLAAPFVEADLLHTPDNVARMARGEGLSDADRWPWLAAVAETALFEPSRPVVVACSALRRTYRDLLRDRLGVIRFVFLDGPPDLIRARMTTRAGHFAKETLLDSQLNTLERPGEDENVILADISQSPAAIVDAVLSELA